jgi:hypothetical protein
MNTKNIVWLGIAALVLALAVFSPIGARAANKTVTNPAAGTVYATLVQGLKLIKQGKFDEWIDSYCHKANLCNSPGATQSVKRYNLPSLKKLLGYNPSCLRGNDDTIVITREDGDPATDSQVKIFLECRTGGMPRPFTMKKEGDTWKFKQI